MVALILVLTLTPVMAGNGDRVLQTETLELTWNADNRGAADWRVRSDPPPGASWESLVSRDDTGTKISRHLAPSGLNVAPEAWQWIDGGSSAVAMEARSRDGRLQVRQRFEPTEEPYGLRYRVEVENVSDASRAPKEGGDLRLGVGPGLGEYPVGGFGIAETLYSYVQPVMATADDARGLTLHTRDHARFIPYKDRTVNWAGLHSRYFGLLVAPQDGTTVTGVELNVAGRGVAPEMPRRYLPVITLRVPLGKLDPGEVAAREFLVFAGPKSHAALTNGDSDFGGLLFANLWSWMRVLCLGLLWLLSSIHTLIPSWGVAILLLAVLVRLILYPVARRALASQKAFADVQQQIGPELAEIKRQYRGEEQSERVLELYKRHGVSPLAGLKPLLIVLIQVPIFIALFHVLGQAYELREASFLWMHTLAEPDRLFALGIDLPFIGAYFNALPILLAITTLMTIKFSPAPAADNAGRRRQNVFLVLMAVAFLVLFYPFPSGMVLYWTMANVLHLSQQYVVER